MSELVKHAGTHRIFPVLCPSSSLFPSKYLFFGLNITSLFLEGFAVQLWRHNQSFAGHSLLYDLFLFAVYFLHILEVFSVGTEVTFSVKEVHKVQVVPQFLIWQRSCQHRFLVLVLDIKALACVVKNFSSSSKNNLGKSVNRKWGVKTDAFAKHMWLKRRKEAYGENLSLPAHWDFGKSFLSFFCHNILLDVMAG